MIRLRLTQPRFSLRSLLRLMSKYRDTPMDFPDATLVWTAEQTGIEQILTLDRRGFSTYRFGKTQRSKLLLDGSWRGARTPERSTPPEHPASS
jgi:predicted nucleic acid-binding protein